MEEVRIRDDKFWPVLPHQYRILSLTSLKQPKDCILRTICEANHQSCLQGSVGREAVEVGTFILISRLPFNNTQDMLEAGRVGRLDYGRTQVVEM